MTQEEITKGNALIATFTGQDKAFDPRDLVYYYHSDWNKLMLVVEMIERLYETPTSLPFMEITAHYSRFSHMDEHYQTVFKILVGSYPESPEKIKCNSKLEATWLVCVEFIKWYNKNKS